LVNTNKVDGFQSVEATTYNSDGDESYQWSVPHWKGRGPHFLKIETDTVVQVVVTEGSKMPADTAIAVVVLKENRSMSVNYHTSGGSEKYFIGGYEVLISDYEKLSTIDDDIFGVIPFYLRCLDVKSRSPEIFSWLDMLDLNVIIIMALMIIISIVNMTSALLILILERQNMIGILKALGDTDRSIIGIFIIHAIAIIGKGVLWGTIGGLLLLFLQWKFNLISLNPEEYFIDAVPVTFDFMNVLVIDAGTILICAFFLLLPSFLVTRITPIKSIRFN